MLSLPLLKRFDIKECVDVDQAECKLPNMAKVCAQISCFYQVRQFSTVILGTL